MSGTFQSYEKFSWIEIGLEISPFVQNRLSLPISLIKNFRVKEDNDMNFND